MDQFRRNLLKECGAGGALVIAAAAGLLPASPASAAPRNTEGFAAKSLADAMASIDAGNAIESADIVITAPDIAENGVLIPIEVTSRVPGAESIALLVEKNPFPLLAYFKLSNGAEGYVNTRFKAGQSSVVKAVVKAGGKTYVASREVKVTIGGCGG
ncbi:MAG TPA: thiosulfate oxidation carrier protein SoxY [Zeimonas sp.]|nr:thiosulfate oxidation carrier protein SoxY [Zeimonas sp.]